MKKLSVTIRPGANYSPALHIMQQLQTPEHWVFAETDHWVATGQTALVVLCETTPADFIAELAELTDCVTSLCLENL